MCVALYEYRDMEESSEAWCAPGLRVEVLEQTNDDWLKVSIRVNSYPFSDAFNRSSVLQNFSNFVKYSKYGIQY